MKKILIVEDEIIIAEDIKNIFISHGYSVTDICCNGKAALDSIEKNKPDLILMDITINGEMDGIDTAAVIKERYMLPVVYATAFSDDTNLARAKITNPFGFILKPFEERELLTIIEMAFYKYSVDLEIKIKQKYLEILAEFDGITNRIKKYDIIKNAIDFVEKTFNLDFISIILFDKVLLKANQLFSNDENNQLAYINDNTLESDSNIAKVYYEKKDIYVKDTAAEIKISETDIHILKNGIKSYLFLPLIFEDKCIGSFNIGSFNIDGIGEQERNILNMLSPRMAVALENYFLYQELNESKEKYREFIDWLPQPVTEAELSGKLIFVNKTCYKYFGYTEEDLQKGVNIFDVVSPEDAKKVANSIQMLLQNQIPEDNTYNVRKKNGEILPVIINSSVIYENSKPVALRSVIVDISQLKLMEQSLEKEKEQLAITLSSIADGVITTNNEGIVGIINHVAEDLTGYKSNEAANMHFNDIIDLYQEYNQLKIENPYLFISNIKKHHNVNYSYILYSKNKTECKIEITGSFIKDKNNIVHGMVFVFRDITNRQKFEEEILKSKKLESIGILAGGIAHDFNNILTMILGNITLGKFYVNSEDKIYDILTEAEKACLRSKDLTQQLLTFSKGGVLIKKISSIKDAINESAVFVSHGSNVKCSFNLSDDLYSVIIDEGQINQVLNNLIINAMQAMPEGGIIDINASNINITEDANIPLQDGKYVLISIKDRGIGISKEHLLKIFDPYFTTKQKGSGLGLAVTYSIIRNHNGYIYAESEISKGTTFYIYLPATDLIYEREEEFMGEIIRQNGRILVMDDEEMIRDVATKMLNYIGYEVDTAIDGNDAILLYQKSIDDNKKYYAVIMDLTIPGGMGGLEAIKKLVGIDPEINAFVSSGYSTDHVMSSYQEYGFKGVMVKPYKIEDLLKILKK